jgi:hypothetical protein
MGLAELVSKETSRYPVTIQTREKVAIDDRFDGLVYHRVISNTNTINDDYSYGLRIAIQNNPVLRTFLAYKVDKGESFKYALRNIFPGIITLTGFEYINVIPSGFNEDHEAIMREEFTNVSYHKHRLPWNVVSFDNTFEFVLCKYDCLQNI